MDFAAMTFGERLRRAREGAGLTQVELANALGVKQNQVSVWENGPTGPKRDRLPAIARAVGATVGWLLVAEGKPPKHVSKKTLDRLADEGDGHERRKGA